jgi:MFS transporter, NNP family, nitrate/nitrite transporter
MFTFARPHMRAFHVAWMGFFMAFFIWFAIAPLLSEMRATLALTKQEIWTSSVVAVAGTIFMRLLVGPLCDKFGSRILFASALIFSSFPTAMVGLTNSARDLALIRLFIGVVGSTFVMTQYWTTRMFTKSVVGTANAVVGGWGNLGGGVTQLVVGSFLFPMLKNFWSDDELKEEKAWRTVCVIPAIFTLLLAIYMVFFTEDAPKGNYWEMKRRGVMPEVSAAVSFRDGALNLNTWILFAQYAGCFGVELTMNNGTFYFCGDTRVVGCCCCCRR